MLKLTHFYNKDEENPKLSLDWFVFEDHWSQRYLFDKPQFDDDMMECVRIRNLNRCSWFRISLNLFHYRIMLDLKLKHLGNVYYGRQMDDNPKPLPKRMVKKTEEPK